jgi:glycosyltransferase involved in cell wall biosynthesis
MMSADCSLHVEGRNSVVRVVPFQPHCFAFGGFDIQMVDAIGAAHANGVDIKPLDFWSRDDRFTLLHCWGLEPQHETAIKWAKKAHRRVVVSALVNDPGLYSTIRFIGSYFFGPGRMRLSMMRNIDAITVVNDRQKQFLMSMTGFPSSKIYVIPNIVKDIFYTPPKAVQGFDLVLSDYVLCVGNICIRKNQLKLVQACKKLGVPLLLVGGVITGEEKYGALVEASIKGEPSIRWLKELPSGSSQLAFAYEKAAAFVLPSLHEQQPISALEAAAARKPILLGDRPYSRQKYFQGAAVVEPTSVSAIAAGLRRVLNMRGLYCPPLEIISECRSSSVGNKYTEVYNMLSGPQS